MNTEMLNHWGEDFLNFAWPMLWQSSLLIGLIFILDLALRRNSRCREFAEVAVRCVVVRLNKLWRVQQVEEFRTELSGEAFRDFEILEGREIDIVKSWTDKRIASQSAGAQCHIPARSPVGRHVRKRGRIEVVQAADPRKGIAHEIGTSGWSTRLDDIEGRTALSNEDQVGLPSAKEGVGDAIPVVAILLAFTKRQLVDSVNDQAISGVDVGVGALCRQIPVVDG